MTEGERVLVLTDGVAVVVEERNTDVPESWCVTFCEACREAWTVDAAEYEPPLTAAETVVLLLDLLKNHRCPS